MCNDYLVFFFSKRVIGNGHESHILRINPYIKWLERNEVNSHFFP